MKQPKPPTQRKGSSHVPGENGIHGGYDLEELARCQNGFHKFLAIPRVNELKIEAHDLGQMAFVDGEELWRPLRGCECLAKGFGRSLTAQNRQKNTAAENRID